MTYGSSRFLTVLAATVAIGSSSLRAHAHAPIPTRVVASTDGANVVLSLPGFGLLTRAQAGEPFVYACDALLGQLPSARTPALALLADGTLLFGGVDGLRRLTRSGCPLPGSNDLARTNVIALAVHASSQTIYALAAGPKAGLWRSNDGGVQWQLRSAIADDELVRSLVVSAADANVLYLSTAGASGSRVLASIDGGETLRAAPQPLVLDLVSADGRAPNSLWAYARDEKTVGNRGIAVLRAAAPEGPWHEALRVDFFGGLVIDARGTTWVGNELGGIYRSDDGGDSFTIVAEQAGVGCLAAGGDSLWSCTPGLTTEPALQELTGTRMLVPTLTLDHVDRLVECPDHDVKSVCAAAWIEWQRDVLMLGLGVADAGPMSIDAGVISPDAAAPTLDEADAGPSVPQPRNTAGCSLTARPSNEKRASWTWLAALCGLACVAQRRRSKHAV